MGVGWVACKCTAGGVSPECVHGPAGLLWEGDYVGWLLTCMQIQRSGQCKFQAPVGAQGGGGSGKGLRQLLASSNKKTGGAKADEIGGRSTVAVLAMCFFICEICWVCLQSRSLGNTIIPVGRKAPAFLPHF